MRLHPDSSVDLTYCTNIHPANGWSAVRSNVLEYASALKAAFAPNCPFGVGLRLSSRESIELLEGTALSGFKSELDAAGLYVSLINGFPYGPFHQQAVKAEVYAPDWRDPERAAYTVRLAKILSVLLPAGADGGISTCPLTYAAWVDDRSKDMDLMASHLVDVVQELVELHAQTGAEMHIDIEPEPDCVLERSDQLVAFYEDHLLAHGVGRLSERSGCTRSEAERAIRRHVAVCLDTCHAAVVSESIDDCIANYREAGIAIGRVQISSALDVRFEEDDAARDAQRRRLGEFADSVYLHQVVSQEHDGSVQRFGDLPEALAAPDPGGARQWRIHFHVPIFTEEFHGLGSTRGHILDLLDAQRAEPVTRHLEIETYTWDVLPGEMQTDLLSSLTREFEWLIGQIAADTS
jgi:sugar phosphate isomerase/epimerase